MTRLRDSFKTRPLPIFFVLAFAISWGAILLIAGPDGIPATPDQAVMLGMAMLLGPTVAGILMTGLASGRAGYRELASRLLRGRVSAQWYAVALLTAPVSTAAVLLALRPFSPEFVPNVLTSDDKATTVVMMGIVAGLMVGLFEELGWTGFAIPRMRQRYSVLATGIIVGAMWGAWHFLLFWESDSFASGLAFALLLARLFSWLPPYRTLMIWVHDRTQSLFVTILMHASLVASLTILEPALSGWNLLTLILVKAALLWLLALLVTLPRRRTSAGPE